MTRSKFEHAKTFGVIASATSNIVWTSDDTTSSSSRNTGAGRAFVAANEEVLCWDVKKGELLSRWRDPNCKAEVTSIAQSAVDRDIFAVGYGDGTIRLWDSKIATVIVSFNGHRSAITTLTFDQSGARLASGSKDTDIVVWDLVSEVGLFKLRGHKDQITGLHFILPTEDSAGDESANSYGAVKNEDGFLISTGKDALVKLWDISSQHCIETHVAQSNGECWALGVSPDNAGCITAGNDGELKVWAIDLLGLFHAASLISESAERRYLVERGVIFRQGKERPLGIAFHPRGDYIAVHGSEKSVEILRVRTEDEIKRHLSRKRKRRREKAGKENIPNGREIEVDEQAEDVSAAEIGEVLVSYVIVRTGGKVRSIDWARGRTSKSIQLLAATTNNQIEVYNIPTKAKKQAKDAEIPDYVRTYSVDMPGHRADVRSLALSSDDRMLASASGGSLKIWNVKTQSCIRTFECGYALCCAFLPGDKIVGTRFCLPSGLPLIFCRLL
jgi:U3 small nucleolar RNA-associated protein 12